MHPRAFPGSKSEIAKILHVSAGFITIGSFIELVPNVNGVLPLPPMVSVW
jgi:hypothetical protein